jgi:hypothetical protein
MTHFAVLVIGDNVERQMAPYHEFECTGVDDQYVQNIDRLAEARAEFGQHGGEYASLAVFIEEWYGAKKIGAGDSPDLSGPHKFGWLRVDANGNALEYIDRTNPHKKWDYWRIGGRWGDFFVLKQGAKGERSTLAWERTFNHDDRVLLAERRAEEQESGRQHADQARKGDVDWEAMAAERMRDAGRSYDEFLTKEHGRPLSSWLHGIEFRPEIDATWRACTTNEERDAWRAARTLADLETRDEFMHRKARRAGVVSVIVRGGEWVTQGEHGWFGSFSEAVTDKEWEELYWGMIASLPDDTMLTIVDCHI